MQKRIDFRDQISKNKRNSVLLLIVVFSVLLFIGYAIWLFLRLDFFIFAAIWIAISLSYILISYHYSANIALFSVGAKKAERGEYRQIYHIVEGLSIASGLPMPGIYIMNSPQINAFASGRDTKHAVICATTGALERLNKEELEGVIAHELSHIKNYDIRFITLVAVMVGMISIISEIFLRSLWFSGDRDRRGNAVIMIAGIVLAILAPIFVKLVQLSISRKREYLADATGVELTRYPKGLANALKKIKNDKPIKVPAAVAPLFLAEPSKRKFIDLFSTHPPIDERIRIIESM